MKVIGSAKDNSLFGSDVRDKIFGMGGYDTIVANGGSDDIVAQGRIEGGDGKDRLHSFYYQVSALNVSASSFDADMGAGKDEVILGMHGGTWSTDYNIFINGIDMGAGRDRLVIGQGAGNSNTGFGAHLGTGADTALVMSTHGAKLTLSESFLVDDGQRDTVRFDGNGEELHISAFFGNDRLIIHDTELTFDELMLRSRLIGDKTEFTLENGSVILIDGLSRDELSEDHIILTRKKLTFTEDIYVGTDHDTTKIRLGSASDDRLKTAKVEELYLGGGDDSGKGAGGADRIFGELGDDRIVGNGGSDHLDGGVGDDTILGNAGGDVLIGGNGRNTLSGGGGGDTIFSISDWDQIRGGRGADEIHLLDDFDGDVDQKDLWRDIWGGAGKDVFILNGANTQTAIHDFRPGKDRIDITALDIDDISVILKNVTEISSEGTFYRDVPGVMLHSLDDLILAGLTAASLSAGDFIY